MSNNEDLVSRVRDFALAALSFYIGLPKNRPTQIAGTQFYRAATAVEANYRSAKRGRSRAEFIAKLGIVAEEADEAVGWLEHMRDGGLATDASLLAEAHELRRIFAKSVGTARENVRRSKINSSPAH